MSTLWLRAASPSARACDRGQAPSCAATGAFGQSYPCLCLCLGFSQITYITPLRLTILHFEQRRLTDAFTFMAITSLTCVIQSPDPYHRCLFLFRASFRLAFRMPCLFALRRNSLLDTNHLFLRTVRRIRALPMSLRKRLSKLS